MYIFGITDTVENRIVEFEEDQSKQSKQNQAWWYTPIIPALGRLRLEG
jgi:hypothetical protein